MLTSASRVALEIREVAAPWIIPLIRDYQSGKEIKLDSATVMSKRTS